jgi:hypothetical protein
MQGAQNKIPLMKKEATLKRKGLKTRPPIKKEATPKHKGLKTIDLR